MIKVIILLSFLLLSLVAANIKLNPETTSFDDYCKVYNCPWSKNELQQRKELFETRVAEIIKHNKNPKKSYTKGLNALTLLNDKELKQRLGYSKTLNHATSGNLKHQLSLKTLKTSANDIPASFNWQDKANVVGVAKDQGKCGSCWANAATAVLESHVAINSGKLYDLSVQQFTSCAPNPNQCGGVGGCEGSTAALAYNYLAVSNDGGYQEMQYPYTSYYGETGECKVDQISTQTSPKVTIDGFTNLKSVDTITLKQIIYEHGPVAVNVDATTWRDYQGGVFDECTTTQTTLDINHVVTLVGYSSSPYATANATTDGYWIVKNSWSPDYGENGFINLRMGTNDAEDNCMMDNTPEDGVECAAGGTPPPVKVCGECGILYDIAYPVNAKSVL